MLSWFKRKPKVPDTEALLEVATLIPTATRVGNSTGTFQLKPGLFALMYISKGTPVAIRLCDCVTTNTVR